MRYHTAHPYAFTHVKIYGNAEYGLISNTTQSGIKIWAVH